MLRKDGFGDFEGHWEDVGVLPILDPLDGVVFDRGVYLFRKPDIHFLGKLIFSCKTVNFQLLG